MIDFSLLDDDYANQARHRSKAPRTLVGRAASEAASRFDRAALLLMEQLFLFGEDVDVERDAAPRIERWKELYDVPREDAPEYFSPSREIAHVEVVSRRRLGDGDRSTLRFESPYVTFDPDLRTSYRAHTRNHRCEVLVWRHRDASRPTVFCLHAWCMGILWFDERVFAAKTLYERGYHVVLPTLPFHGSRTPREATFGGQMFPSPRLDHTNEAFRQAVIEIRALRSWLTDHGQTGPYGLMGISLGGYISALMASLWDDWHFVVPVIAPASFADILWWHGEDRPMREAAMSAGVDLQALREVWAVHCPLRYALRLDKERAMIVAGTGDEIVRPAQSRAMWRHWNEPRMRWVVGSHLAQLRWLAGSRVTRWGGVDFMSHVLPFLDRFA